jgi:tetratricopeptide (TPR) repeat protein
LATPYGPFDYRTASKEVLKLVEDHHFNRDVETLKKGISGTIGGELNYTLRVIPNHHRALNALINLQFKLKTDRPPGTSWKVPCYFDRAIRFQPNDGTVREIYGVYLMRLGNKNEAVRQLELAAQLGGEDGNLAYNLGLAYFDVGNFDKSVMYAKKAYDLGFTLPGLKAKLKKAGKWPEDQ